MGGSSGWQAEEQYDKMESVALAKKPEDREPWEKQYLKSLKKMRLKEQSGMHWSWHIFKFITIYLFLTPIVYIIYECIK